jgi:amidase
MALRSWASDLRLAVLQRAEGGAEQGPHHDRRDGRDRRVPPAVTTQDGLLPEVVVRFEVRLMSDNGGMDDAQTRAVTPAVRPRPVDVTTDDALGADDMTGLLERLARRQVSPDELRTAALARGRVANGLLNAVTAWADEPVVTEVSVAADAPLSGIPTFVKDNEDLTGFPTTEASWAVPDRRAGACSPWVAQYLALGVAALGKTTLSEFGLTASTETRRFGATRNPWHTGRSAGGSSGGSAALVAAGVVPIAHANDGGGSIRIPASCCGLVGLKPSRGRLVDLPELDRAPVNLSTQGVLTRTVRDTARYLAEAERVYRNPSLPTIGHVRDGRGPRLRIGVASASIRGLPVAQEVRWAVQEAGRLCQDLGHEVEETGPVVGEEFGPDFLRYWSFVAFLLTRAGKRWYGPGFDARRAEAVTRGLARLFVQSPERFPGSLQRLRRLARDHERAFERFDVVLSPVLGHEPPPIGHLGPDVDFRTHLVRLLRYTSFTPVQNVSGSPALSLPLGLSSTGLPIGVQLAAPYGSEARLIALAYELEEAAPWPTRPRAFGTTEG